MALSKKPVNGMKDILPNEMQIRDYVINVIQETYAEFGFTRIETPCVENIANFSVIYGTLGAVIVLLMWLYMTAVILILGAELNAAIMDCVNSDKN